MAAISLADILRSLQMAGAATDAVKALVGTVKPLFNDADQATLMEALADAQAENDEGYARLDAKLKAAEAG